MNIGDKVKMISYGPTYPSYKKGFHLLGMTNPDEDVVCLRCDEGKMAIIMNMKPHPDTEKKTLVFIKLCDDGKEYLIEKRGLTFIAKRLYRIY